MNNESLSNDPGTAPASGPLPGNSAEGAVVEIPAPTQCNHIDVTRGRCTLAYGHEGDHVWTNPDEQPIDEYLDEVRAKVEAAGGFKPIDPAQVSEQLLDQAEPNSIVPSSRERLAHFLQVHWPEILADLKASGIETNHPQFRLVSDGLTIIVNQLIP